MNTLPPYLPQRSVLEALEYLLSVVGSPEVAGMAIIYKTREGTAPIPPNPMTDPA